MFEQFDENCTLLITKKCFSLFGSCLGHFAIASFNAGLAGCHQWCFSARRCLVSWWWAAAGRQHWRQQPCLEVGLYGKFVFQRQRIWELLKSRHYFGRLTGNASRTIVEEAEDNETLYFSVSEPNSTNETWRRSDKGNTETKRKHADMPIHPILGVSL